MTAAADPRLDPAQADPAHVFDCTRSQARVADIEFGMKADPKGDWYWHDQATRRVQALQLDAAAFGLWPHEEAELELLKGLLVDANNRLAIRNLAA